MKSGNSSRRRSWAAFRFSVVGSLLTGQLERGDLKERFAQLAQQTWKHPINGEPLTLGASTIERWYYRARGNDRDPVAALERPVQSGAGRSRAMHDELTSALRTQHAEHPSWSYLLHYETLVERAKAESKLQPIPSYPTVRRFMQSQGLVRQKKRKKPHLRERRSYEVEHVHALWHADFHQGSRKVLMPDGSWVRPVLLGFMDDHSRLVCHLQWYLHESAQTFVHGLVQALMKRGVPRALLTDNGKPMLATETTEGLQRLGVVHETTLPYTPEANGKQESFWGQIEGRLMPQLEGEKQLTLALLNRATLAWLEQDYNQRVHSELKLSPMKRFLDAPNLGRDCPPWNELRGLFRREERRRQRLSDGTITVGGRRFEVPTRYRMLRELAVRFAAWDLSQVALVDKHRGTHLADLYPLDKSANADKRRLSVSTEEEPAAAETGIAPLLASQMKNAEQNGLAPAYLPLTDEVDPEGIF